MKYYHIIYNSSEKPMDGGVGFGIRTATEGTPDGLIKAVKSINFFTDDWESYESKPSPAKIKENPSSMESIAKNYAVTSIVDEEGHTYYIIARRAYVGFDYGFYKNGMPTRPGNYVIDFYAFDSIPESSVYEILYENALADSNHFIPKSVQPTEDNEEMRQISIGTQTALPVSEKGFEAHIENALDKDVVKLFFTYLNSQKTGKKLVVKASKEKALKLTADLYRMLDSESAKSVRTYINLRSQGVNDNFDIFFIHEDYPHQIYPGLFDYVEIESAEMPSTTEAQTFGKDLENLVTSSFEANKDDVYDTLKWLLMPEYETVKSLSKLTIDSFFCYCIQPNNFMYENLKDTTDKLNDEFLGVLCPYTKKDKKNAERFNMLVTEAMNDASANDIIGLIDEYNHFQSLGFNLDEITNAVKQNVCSVLLSDIKLFKNALDTLKLEGVKKFFVKTVFEDKNEYVNTNVLDIYMLHLYKWFICEEDLELKNRYNVLYHRFMKRDMKSDIFCSIVDDMFGEDQDIKIKFFIQILQKELKPFKFLWPYFEHYLADSQTKYDFVQQFESKLEDEEYAPMFYYSILKNKGIYEKPENVCKLTSILSKNAKLKGLIEVNYDKDFLYKGFYGYIKSNCNKNPQQALSLINDNVLGFLKVKDQKFNVLAFYLDMVVSGDCSKAKKLNEGSLKLIYNEINEQRDSKLFKELLPNFINICLKGVISESNLASQFASYFPQMHTINMLECLVPKSNKDWVEMISAIISDVREKNFEEAFSLAKEFGMDSESLDRLMTKSYEKDYIAYKRKNKIKNFFVALKNIFSPKKKEKIDNMKEAGKTDKKTISKKKNK